MRIGLLANTFTPSVGAVAGGHIHFIEVAKRWTGVELSVFAPAWARDAILRELPSANFVPTPSFDRFLPNHQLRMLARTLLAVARVPSLRRCDVVLATSHFVPDVIPSLFARHGRRIVCIQHVLASPLERQGFIIANVITSIFQTLSLWLVKQHAGAVFVNSIETANRLGIDQARTKVFVMTQGMEHLPILPAISDANRSGSVFIGRLVPTKGIDDLLQSWADVIRSVPDAVLTIAGAGAPNYTARLRKLAAALRLNEHVHFVGRVSEHEKATLLNRSELFVFPSKEEGWGIAIGEAMTYGLGCVLYDLPAYQGIFDQGCLKAKIADIADFARKVTIALTDRELQDRLAREAHQLASTFSWQRAATIELGALQEVARK